jgi:hypothetical protein
MVGARPGREHPRGYRTGLSRRTQVPTTEGWPAEYRQPALGTSVVKSYFFLLFLSFFDFFDFFAMGFSSRAVRLDRGRTAATGS